METRIQLDMRVLMWTNEALRRMFKSKPAKEGIQESTVTAKRRLKNTDPLQLGQGHEGEGQGWTSHLKTSFNAFYVTVTGSYEHTTQTHVTFHITRIRTDAGSPVFFCFSTLLNRYS